MIPIPIAGPNPPTAMVIPFVSVAIASGVICVMLNYFLNFLSVIPANAGIHPITALDSHFRGNDGRENTTSQSHIGDRFNGARPRPHVPLPHAPRWQPSGTRASAWRIPSLG